MTNNTSVNPSEVGWQFVPQYYTFVNKHPNRLHCFYNKSSTFIHGTEGEDGKPCFGQQEIHNKITSIGFQDCKVFIHSVDAQSSANGGIIIQVIGEMSNKGEAWRKFVQTFFLAEQPNGYFVLNDIFRFLKEESVDEGDEQEQPEAVSQQPPAEQHVPAPPAPPSPAPPPAAEPEPVPTTTPAPPQPVAEQPASAPSPAPEAQPQTNGHAPEAKREPTPAPREPSPAPAPEPAATASPAPASPPAQQQQPAAPVPSAPSPAPAPQPQQQPQQSQQQQAFQQAAPAPAAPAPSRPKTWASLAAKGASGWGPAVATQSRGTSEAPAPHASASPAPLNGPQSPAPHVTTRPLARQEPHPAYIAAQSIQTPQCFVKGVTENVTEAALRTTLTTRFGPIKELEIVRNKACAFIEFQSLESAKRAIIASLPHAQGGEGGIRIETDGGAGQARITVETRKERGERPGQRGGAPINGDRGRGGFEGSRWPWRQGSWSVPRRSSERV
ncbi:hypothetical protein BN946_scf184999.g20 [Trametes cinnabarina]|uniref:NTF2 domain-containing protein n=1 Tax=Pycnoporus cinnabarinus TaxID=5643 RepID=A0A060S7Q3_PYCCI|nr:hypothetical protein BN946_scf184999.g20 [Trametes cinnabarina]